MLNPAQERSVRTAFDTAGKYTAVVYVHGMGSQRRYEELSRLLDSLERHARTHEATAGRLDLFEVRLEPPRGGLEREVGFVEVLRQRRASGDRLDQELFRFYEAYWAPLAADGATAREVLGWLLRQGASPIRALFSSWRDRARLRRAYLHELLGQDPGLASATVRDRLISMYDMFDGPAAREMCPQGTFSEFCRFVRTRGDDTAAALALARQWHRFAVRRELRNLAVILTLLLTMGLAGAGVLAAVTLLLPVLVSAVRSTSIVPLQQLVTSFTAQGALAITGSIFTLVGVTRFLVNYLGDVLLWTTYEETDAKYQKRRAILKTGVDYLRHVLADPDCRRAVVIGHSLGTAIAQDSLLELNRINRAAPSGTSLPLTRLDHLITLASPIDKIHYFFESYQGGRYRYNQIVEDIRGDLGTLPFTETAGARPVPHMHWINVWDRADIIGGSVETPSSRSCGDLRVDNLEVSMLRFPSPGTAHSAYFEDAHVMREVFEAVFDRKGSLVEPPLDPPETASAVRRYIGPGAGAVHTRLIQGLLMLVPWLVLVTVAVHLFARDSALRTPLTVLSTAGALLGIGGIVLGDRIFGRRSRVESAT